MLTVASRVLYHLKPPSSINNINRKIILVSHSFLFVFDSIFYKFEEHFLQDITVSSYELSCPKKVCSEPHVAAPHLQ